MQKKLLETKVFRRITDTSPKDWAEIFPSKLEGYYFFKTLEETLAGQFSFYYILVYQENAVVGIAPCFLMEYPLETTLQGGFRDIALFLKKIFPHFFSFKALICGCPMEQGRIGVRSGDPNKVLQAMVAQMEMIAKSERTIVMAFKDFGSAHTAILESLKRHGFGVVPSLPSTEIEIDFENFAQYLNTLSPVSKKGIKRKFKKVEEGPKIDLEITHKLTPDVLTQAYGLFLQTVKRNDIQFENLPKEFFDRLVANMPDVVRFFLWRIEGKLVAFALCLVSEKLFVDFYLGFDYAIAHDYNLYYVRFRDLMNWCIEHKIKRYDMGNTGYEPKRRLGFKMIPLNIYAKCCNPFLNPFFKLLLFFLKPERFDPVLKEMRDKDRL